MIVVVADDFSGAAELANAAAGAGFSVELQMGCAQSDAEVVCIDADTRSLPGAEAAAIFSGIGCALAARVPELVFKKCDSVLRGNVAVESRALAVALGRSRVVLASANPSRGRVIRDGRYYVAGTPLDQTAFASDPEHPRRTANVRDLLGDCTGIDMPDVDCSEDLARIAGTVDAATLPVGALDFFEALLRSRTPAVGATPAEPRPIPAGPALFVCGSAAAWCSGRDAECARRGIPVLPMPQALFSRELAEDVLSRWADSVAHSLRTRRAAMIAIGSGEPVPGVTPAMLVERLAQAVENVTGSIPCARIALEGGATAAAVLRQLGFRRFRAIESPGAGVGAFVPLGEDAPVFLAKPGSYPWPDAVWSQ